MNLACPHCGAFERAPFKSRSQFEDHLFYVHHEGWP